MSQTDSFIDEVSEEVRTDRLWHLFRRYGWIAAVVIVVIVGGAAWNEYRKATSKAAAEALGDEIVAALDAENAEVRLAQLSDVEAPEQVQPIVDLMRGATAAQDEDAENVIAALEPLTADAELGVIYRDLAALKLLLLGDAVPLQLREELVAQITAPGRPYRVLGLEQALLIQIEQGQEDVALQSARDLLQEAGVTQGLQQRLTQLIFALGGSPADF
ncbi:MAG: hypothetical protein AAFQ66_09010 [Pseudomonadota bacterium]